MLISFVTDQLKWKKKSKQWNKKLIIQNSTCLFSSNCKYGQKRYRLYQNISWVLFDLNQISKMLVNWQWFHLVSRYCVRSIAAKYFDGSEINLNSLKVINNRGSKSSPRFILDQTAAERFVSCKNSVKTLTDLQAKTLVHVIHDFEGFVAISFIFRWHYRLHEKKSKLHREKLPIINPYGSGKTEKKFIVRKVNIMSVITEKEVDNFSDLPLLQHKY